MRITEASHSPFKWDDHKGDLGHCCGCLASAVHEGFDQTGCEFCDPTVLVLVAVTEAGDYQVTDILLGRDGEPDLEHRTLLELRLKARP